MIYYWNIINPFTKNVKRFYIENDILPILPIYDHIFEIKLPL